jgi:hypothetical protein
MSKTHENINECNKCSILKGYFYVLGFMDTYSLYNYSLVVSSDLLDDIFCFHVLLDKSVNADIN